MAKRDDGDRELIDEPPSTFELIRRFGPLAVVVIAAALFMIQNTDDTRFAFLWFEFDLPLWVMLIVFGAVGALLFWLVSWRRRRAKAKKAQES